MQVSLSDLRSALNGRHLVNLVGPLGSGKSTYAIETVPEALYFDLKSPGQHELPAVVIADNADCPETIALLHSLIADNRTVIAISRRPLLSQPNAPAPSETFTLQRLSDTQIVDLVNRWHFTDPLVLRQILELSGGIPLIAKELCRAFHSGIPVESRGAAADRVVTRIVERLAREWPGSNLDVALATVAAVGQTDQELLTKLLPDTVFAHVAALSLVVPTPLGLSVRDPYRTLLDLAYQWRQPVEYQSMITAAAAHHRELLSVTHDNDRGARLVLQSLFLASGAADREYFRPLPAPVRIEQAGPADEADIARLVRHWATWGELNPQTCQRMLDGWLSATPEGLYLGRDGDGRAVGLVNLVPMTERALPTLEPLLQQHLSELDRPGAPGLLLSVTASMDQNPATLAAMFRFILAESLRHGRLMISTPSPAYQRLVSAIGFQRHGETRSEVYDGGRKCGVYSQEFAVGSVLEWLSSRWDRPLPEALRQGLDQLVQQVRAALEHLDDPHVLARNPLAARVSGPDGLRALLTDRIQDLCASPNPAEAQAGEVLSMYYLRRRGSHVALAMRLHLSRATYFRRLQQGISTVAGRL